MVAAVWALVGEREVVSKSTDRVALSVAADERRRAAEDKIVPACASRACAWRIRDAGRL